MKFERATEDVRKALLLARDKADECNDPILQTRYLFHGLLEQESIPFERILAGQPISVAELKANVRNACVDMVREPQSDKLFSQGAKRAFHAAGSESLLCRKGYLDEIDLLIGLLREEDLAENSLLGGKRINLPELRIAASTERQLCKSA